MNDVPIFAAVRKIVRRHSKNPLEGLVQLDVDELNAALQEARGGASVGQRPETAGNLGTAAGGVPGAPEPPVQAGGMGPVLHAGLSDAAAFFASVNTAFGKLDQSQVDGFGSLLAAMGAAGWPLSFAAYGLATPWLETARTMQPIHERGGDAYFKRMYDIAGERPQKARELGNLSPGDGARYAGRGYVQLTGKANYRKAEAALGLPLVADPDLAMKHDVAAKVLVWGMSEGAFTGKKLAHYLPRHGPADHDAFKQARRIINGTDRNDEIADFALKFQRALSDGGWA